MIKYHPWSKIYKCSQIIVTLSELKSSFKWLWRLGWTAKRPKKDPYRRQIHNVVFIFISYRSFKEWSSLKKKNLKLWENSQHLCLNRHLKAQVSETWTYKKWFKILWFCLRNRLKIEPTLQLSWTSTIVANLNCGRWLCYQSKIHHISAQNRFKGISEFVCNRFPKKLLLFFSLNQYFLK